VLAVVLVTLGILAVSVTPLVYAAGGREKQIREVVATFEEAYRAGDVDRIMEFYADDAISMPPGFPASVGKAAIRADFEMFYTDLTVEERNFQITDIWIAGNLATRRAVWDQTLSWNDGSAPPFTEYGQCVVSFKKLGNEWKVIWEIWNTHPGP
jgi:ketosteroid isomerase-like protein